NSDFNSPSSLDVPLTDPTVEAPVPGAIESAALAQAGASHPSDAPILLRRYDSYRDAQRAVDYLSDHEFPVERTAIAARNLSFVERVIGRLTAGKAAMQGALGGAAFGFFLSLMLGIFIVNPQGWVTFVASSTALGSLFGGLLALVGFLASGGERDFQSVGAMTAESYDVMVDPAYREKAEMLVNGMSAA
ncbi:MAG: hypothetical protein KDA61_14120, partial [Planctomycetales bacterium]|nr:hypothetical protein [Planctomycetales bacterium]